jgi:hypothetical protein
MYADDSTLYRHIKTFDDMLKLQEELSNILLWSVNNGMKLNPEKCRFMDVTLSSFRRYGIYNINGVPLGHAEHVKMLGVYVSFNLSWNTHVEYTRAKCAKLLWFVERILKGCTPKIKCQAFQTLIRHVLFHGVPGWHPTTAENMIKLQRVQNKASRLIFGKNSTHELDKRILSVKHAAVQYTDLLYIYKCRNALIDCNITSDIRIGRQIRGEENVLHRLIPPKARTSLYQSGFGIRSVSLWNNLPANVKLSTMPLYKNNLLLHLRDNP